MKFARTLLSHFAILLAGVWVLAFAVLPHHHDPDTGMPCLDFHHEQQVPNHDECGLTKTFLIEFQREENSLLIPVHAQMLPDINLNCVVLREVIGWIVSKPYAFAILLNERVFDLPGRAPPRACV